MQRNISVSWRQRSLSAALMTALGVNLLPSPLLAAEPAAMATQPAITSVLAAQSVMLSVARAGQRLVAVGERGFIIVSDDNGGSWKQVPSPVSTTLVKVRFVDDRQGWAVGHCAIVLHTADGGSSWAVQLDGVRAADLELQAATLASTAAADPARAEEQTAQAQQLVDDGPDKPFLDLWFQDARHGLVVGAYGLAFTTEDGGASWQPIRTHLDNPQGLHLYSIIAAGKDIFVGGEQGILLRSSDLGQTFEALAPPYEGTIFGLQATANGVLAFGLRGKAYASTDRGDSWQRLDTLQPVTLTSALALADGSVLLTDESGRVLKLGADLRTLTLQQSSPAGYLTGLVEAANGQLITSSARGVDVLASAAQTPELAQ